MLGQGENQVLRSTMEELQGNVEQLGSSLDASLNAHETKLQHQLQLVQEQYAETLQKLQNRLLGVTTLTDDAISDAFSAVLGPDKISSGLLCQPEQARTSSVTSPTAGAGAQQTRAVHQSAVKFKLDGERQESVRGASVGGTAEATPPPSPQRAGAEVVSTPATRSKTALLEGTPGARPVSWVVEQVNPMQLRLSEMPSHTHLLILTEPYQYF